MLFYKVDFKMQTFLILVLFWTTCNAANDRVNPSKYDLLKYLLDPERYDPSIFPGFFTDENLTNVTVQMAISNFGQIREKEMQFELTMFLRMNWIDPRLAYINNATYDKLELSGDKVDSVWTPDLYFDKDRKSDTHQMMQGEKLVYIAPLGQMAYSQRSTVSFACDMDLYYYPKDTQHCSVSLQSYAFTSDELLLLWSERSPIQILDPFTPGFEVSVEKIVDRTTVCYEDSIVGGNFSSLSATFILDRQISYGYTYIIPDIAFFVVALTSYGVKDMTSKVGTCTGAITSIILQWIAVYSIIPSVSSGTALDAWITTHITVVSMVLVYHVFMYWMYPKQKKTTEPNGTSSEIVKLYSKKDIFDKLSFYAVCIVYCAAVPPTLLSWGFSAVYFWCYAIVFPILLGRCIFKFKVNSLSGRHVEVYDNL